MTEDKKGPGRPKKADKPETEAPAAPKAEAAPPPAKRNLTRERIAERFGDERAAQMVK